MKQFFFINLAFLLIIFFHSPLQSLAQSKSKYYYIQAKVSKRNISTQGSKNPRSKIVQKAGAIDANRWRIIPAGDGYYFIHSRDSGMYLQVNMNSKEKGALITHFPFNGSSFQQWKLEPAGDDYYFIRSRGSGLYVDVQGGSKDEGATIWQFELNKTDAQKWRFVEAGKVRNMNRAITEAYFKKYNPDPIGLYGHNLRFGETKDGQPPIAIGKYGTNTVLSAFIANNVRFHFDDNIYFLMIINENGVVTDFSYSLKSRGAVVSGAPEFKYKKNISLSEFQIPQENHFYSDKDIDAMYDRFKGKDDSSIFFEAAAAAYMLFVYTYKQQIWLDDYRNRMTLNGQRKADMAFLLPSERFPLPESQRERDKTIDHRN